MARRSWSVAVLVATLLIGLLPGVASATPPPLPGSIAAVGDSITQAASSGGSLGTDYPQNSWATGTSGSVNSHYLRLQALNPAIGGHASNLSVSGAKMADLNGQMQLAASVQPDYLTVLIGGNDICTDTEAQMTPVADFSSQFQAAMTTLSAGSPNTNIYVVSIPRVMGLWELFHNNWWARLVWSAGNVCQSLLANAGSNQTADVQRRARVAQRNVDFNGVLAEVCAATARCLWDGGAVYNTSFTSSDVSGDYFHPSVQGQAKLASVSWGAGYWAAGAPPPPNQVPTASFTYLCSDLSCSFDGSASSDPDGSISSHAWSFGDGSTGSGVAPTHAFATSGTYTVSLTVTDNGGATGSSSQPVTVTAPQPTGTVSLAALAGSASERRGGWTATVTVTVRDGDGALVSGATVSGTWSPGGGSSCTTGASGTCSASVNMGKKTSSVTWSVAGITHPTLAYDPTRNVVTSIIVNR